MVYAVITNVPYNFNTPVGGTIELVEETHDQLPRNDVQMTTNYLYGKEYYSSRNEAIKGATQTLQSQRNSGNNTVKAIGW